MSSASFSLDGLDAMVAKLLAHGGNVARRVEGSVHRGGERVMADSKAHYVPVRDGILRGTGHVRKAVRSGKTVYVELVYGGPAAPYAGIQHEEPDFQHRVGEWKYLETPLMRYIPQFPSDLADDIRFEDLT